MTTVYLVLAVVFLIVLPFVNDRTRLLRRFPRVAFFVPPVFLSLMNAPAAAVNGERWGLTSTGFLFCVTLIVVGYQTVTLREGGCSLWHWPRWKWAPYPACVSLLLISGYFLRGAGFAEQGSLYQIFLVSFGFLLYALNLLESSTGQVSE